MKIIIISSTNKNPNEPITIAQLFRNGLEIFHLRKPNFSEEEMEEYLNQIPLEYLNRIVIHSHHKLALKYNLRGIHLTRKLRNRIFRTWLRMRFLKSKNPNIKITTSFHSLKSLFEDKRDYDYVFLSPVFDSISKSNYQAKFTGHNFEVLLKKVKHKVIALGGVDIDKVDKIRKKNFAGMALLGAIWESSEPLEIFLEIKEACSEFHKAGYLEKSVI